MNLFKLGFAALAVTTSFAAQAGSIWFFGDSLSDTGNLNILSQSAGGPPRPDPADGPYQPGQYTDRNGFVWSAQFAQSLGRPGDAAPAWPRAAGGAGGNNFAVAAARTYDVAGGVPSTGTQVSTYLALTPSSSAQDLFVLMIGGNDLAQFATGQSTVNMAAVTANLKTQIQLLAADGAKHFLVADMPNVADTPVFQGLEVGNPGIQAGARSLRNQYNGLFYAMINELSASIAGVDIDILRFGALDTFDFAGNGITNTTSPCFAVPRIAANVGICNSYLYSDSFHPTARAHSFIAAEALRAVPLPSTLALFGLGLFAVAAMRRKSV
jgi:phospholipase/lecithinase/hemolysin